MAVARINVGSCQYSLSLSKGLFCIDSIQDSCPGGLHVSYQHLKKAVANQQNQQPEQSPQIAHSTWHQHAKSYVNAKLTP